MIREPEKEALEYLRTVLKVCPNRGNFFQNKLQNAWTAIPKTAAFLRLEG